MEHDSPPPERRHRQPGRRVADAVAATGAIAYEVIDDDVRDLAVALHHVQKSWKRWAVVAGAIATVVSATIGVMIWLGWSNSSPAQRFQSHDSTMRANITDVNTEMTTLKTRVSNLEDAMDLVSYLLCVQIRRSDPAALPPACNGPSIRRLAPR